MSTIQIVTTALGHCNLHFCIYGALGASLLWRAVLARGEHKDHEAREHGLHGLLHLVLALL